MDNPHLNSSKNHLLPYDNMDLRILFIKRDRIYSLSQIYKVHLPHVLFLSSVPAPQFCKIDRKNALGFINELNLLIKCGSKQPEDKRHCLWATVTVTQRRQHWLHCLFFRVKCILFHHFKSMRNIYSDVDFIFY